MRPSQSRKEDWIMYFDNTYMIHDELGPLHISVRRTESGNTIMKGRVDRNSIWRSVRPNMLDVYWPDTGAYNGDTGAFFVGRRSRRITKKSACYDFYYLVWPVFYGDDESIAHYLETAIQRGHNYLPLEEAKAAIDEERMRSVAIGKDLIIYKSEEQKGAYNLLYNGENAGQIINNEFFPEFAGTPVAKRARAKLLREGLCI